GSGRPRPGGARRRPQVARRAGTEPPALCRADAGRGSALSLRLARPANSIVRLLVPADRRRHWRTRRTLRLRLPPGARRAGLDRFRPAIGNTADGGGAIG